MSGPRSYLSLHDAPIDEDFDSDDEGFGGAMVRPTGESPSFHGVSTSSRGLAEALRSGDWEIDGGGADEDSKSDWGPRSGVRRRSSVSLPGSIGDGDEPLELADLEGAGYDVDEDMRDKLVVLADRLLGYKRKLESARKRAKAYEEELTATRSQLSQVKQEKHELELERDKNALLNKGGRRLAFELRGRTDEAEQRKKEAINQLLTGSDLLADDSLLFASEDKLGRQVWMRVKLWLEKHYPLSSSIRSIESRYGTSVAAHFELSRWVFVNYIYLSIMLCIVFLLHIFSLLSRDSVEWTAVAGFLPVWVQFSSFTSDEALTYIATLWLCMALLLVLAVNKWIAEDRRAKEMDMTNDAATDRRYSVLVLNAWDHSIWKKREVEDQQFFVADHYNLLRYEEQLKVIASQRTRLDKCKIFTRRLVGILLSMSVQAASASLIIFLTLQSSTVQRNLSEALADVPSLASVVSVITNSIVPASVSVINAALPFITDRIAKFEGWDDQGSFTKTVIWRLYLSKTLNVLIQVFSYAQLADPFLFATLGNDLFDGVLDVRANTAKDFQPALYQCRADQTGAQLFTLVFTEFVLSKVIALANALAPLAWQRCRGQHLSPNKFMVERRMVDLLYFQMVVLMAFPFFPLSSILCTILFFLNFKFEKLLLESVLSKPLKPWSAKDAGSFFIKFYLISVGIAMAGVHLVLLNNGFPKSCDLMTATALHTEPPRYQVENCDVLTNVAPFVNITRNTTFPNCICGGSLACGPFADRQDGYDVLRTMLQKQRLTALVYNLTVANPVLGWLVAAVSIIAWFFKKNSLQVMNEILEEKDTTFNQMRAAQGNKIRALRRQVEAQRAVNARRGK
eukprot:PLAT3606.3.p1 GENE.PLAT3606.3~~PLAT3606.3.p1  ORF type:complete len:852 (+),score=356.19 PLAT3606.3:57-2612(+)